MQVITKNSEETKNIAGEFSRRLKDGEILALYGDLGSGKTTFVQGLAKGLGITQRIISPTFIIVRSYELKTPAERAGPPAERAGRQIEKHFYHIDLYRVQNKKDLQSLGLFEILNNQNNIVVIEWAKKMSSLLPKKRWDITFDHISESKRKISIRKI